jgi:tetratricopeptide (TPR) repeat protein
MLQDHPTTEDLEGFLRAASQRGHAVRNAVILRHLLASCPVCRNRLEAMGWPASRLVGLVYLPGGRQGDETGDVRLRKNSYNYDRAFARTEQVVEEFLATAPPPSQPVEQLLAELDRAPRELQLASVEEDERFAVPQLVPPLIERSHAIRYDDPEAMLHWAQLARSIASRSSVEAVGNPTRLGDLRTRAWGQYGNALRVNSRLHEAENALITAHRYLAEGSGDPLLKALLYEQTASLYTFQRRFDEAVSSLTDAAEIYRQLGETHAFARTLIHESNALLQSGEAEAAVDRLNQAIPLIDHEVDPHLLLAACHNLMRCYIGLDQPERALSIYAETENLYREFGDSVIQLRAKWQEGQLLRDLGHLQTAETALLRARQGFLERGLMYEMALVCLDLAALYVKLKAIDNLKEIVIATVPIFRALRVDREALASLLQLQQVADQEQQAMELIRFLNARIEPLARRGLLK